MLSRSLPSQAGSSGAMVPVALPMGVSSGTSVGAGVALASAVVPGVVVASGSGVSCGSWQVASSLSLNTQLTRSAASTSYFATARWPPAITISTASRPATEMGLSGSFDLPSRPPPDASTSFRKRATFQASIAATIRYSRIRMLTTNTPARTAGWTTNPSSSKRSTRRKIPPASASSSSGRAANASARA